MVYKKGYAFERELKIILEKDGWRVIRSGKSRKPDLIAGRKGKIIVIECKATMSSKVYLEKDEVSKLKEVADAFHGECIYAVKQKNKGFHLVRLSQLREVENSFVLDLESMENAYNINESD